MKEIVGNLWDYKGQWIIVPTNNTLKKCGCAIMGAGVAKQAALCFPNLPKELGFRIQFADSGVHLFSGLRIIAVPTKNHWRDKSDISLITQGIIQLRVFVKFYSDSLFYLPRLGCGLGGLNWETEVKPSLARMLDDRFVVVHKE